MYVIKDKASTKGNYILEAVHLTTFQTLNVEKVKADVFRVCMTVPGASAKPMQKRIILSSHETEAEAVATFWEILNSLAKRLAYHDCETSKMLKPESQGPA